MDLRRVQASNQRPGYDYPGDPNAFRQEISRGESGSRRQSSPLRHTIGQGAYPSVTSSDAFRFQHQQSEDFRGLSAQDSHAQIEQRHAELKKQIAIKEQQLAQMTSERESSKALRNKLGLSTHSKALPSGRSIISEEHRGRQDAKGSLRGPGNLNQSHSPVPQPGFVGLRSSHMHRQSTSQSRDIATYGQQRVEEPLPERNPMLGKYGQPLQFHPTRQTREIPKQSSRSPLRSRSRSGGQQPMPAEVHKNDDSAYQSFNDRSISPYSRPPLPGHRTMGQVPGGRNSPLRNKSPPHQKHFDSFNAQNYEGLNMDSMQHGSSTSLIKPTPVQNNYMGSTNAFTGAGPQTTYGQQTEQLQRFQGPDARNQLYSNRIQTMTADNESLQRRLNQVSAELERIHRERDEMVEQLNKHQHNNGKTENLVNTKDTTDIQNQRMQEDLERQKEENIRLTGIIKQQELETNQTNEQLLNTNFEKDKLENERNHNANDVSSKIEKMNFVQQDRANTIKQLNTVNLELDRLNSETRNINHHNIDLESHVSRLQAERADILSNLERLTVTYDDCVRDITRERRNMNAHNDQHTKLIVAKIVFMNLEQCIKDRKQASFKELVDYTQFDKDCHLKLKTLYMVINKLGKYKQKVAINQWYDKALKPLNTRHQNDDVAIFTDCNRLQSKVFYAWKQYQRDKQDRYYFKTNSIDRIWHIMNKESQKEQKRAFSIWKEKLGFNVHLKLKLLKRLKTKHDSQRYQAFQKWKNYSTVLEHSCRVKILHMDFTQKLFLSQVFYQMRTALQVEKRQRLRMLRSFYKGWKDSIKYNRHLMQTNMAAIQFSKENERMLKQNIFDAIKNSAEQRKFSLLNNALHEDMDVAVAEHEEFNKNFEQQLLKKNQTRAGKIVTEMLGRRLFAYFNHWRLDTEYYNQTMKTKVADKLIRLMLGKMGQAFKVWKDKGRRKHNQIKKKMMMEMQQQKQEFETEQMEQSKNLGEKAEQTATQQRKMVDKTFRKLYNRRVAVALNRWKDKCVLKQTQADKASRMLIRAKRRFLKQGFEKYLDYCKRHRQHQRNNAGADNMVDTLNKRIKAKTFNSMCYYIQQMRLAKKYFTKIDNKFNKLQKRKSFGLWKQNAELKYLFELDTEQKNIISQIEDLNAQIGEKSQDEKKQEDDFGEHDKLQRKKAYKQIGNYFMRSYEDTIKRSFRMWRQNVHDHIHKEKVIKRSIDHWRKNSLKQCQYALNKFMSEQRRLDAQNEIKRCIIEANEVHQTIVNEKRKQEELRQQRNETVAAEFNDGGVLEKKYQFIMATLERRSHEWQYASKKRMVFIMWRHRARQQKAFLICCRNVFVKSMQQQAINSIKNYVKDEVNYTNSAHRSVRKLSRRFTRINCADAFTKWKMAVLQAIADKQAQAEKMLTIDDGEFLATVDTIKDQNMRRCTKYFYEKNLSTYLHAWKFVIKYWKLQKAKTAEFHARQKKIQQLDAIKLWKARYQKTKFCKARYSQLVQKFQFKYYRACFNQLKNNFMKTRNFVKRLSNFEVMMRGKTINESFSNIKTFAMTKGAVFRQRKLKGTEDLVNLVKQSYLKNLKVEFQRYRKNCSNNKVRDSKLTKVYGKFCTERTRDAFNWWKMKAGCAQLVKDMHETGPVRAEWWEAQTEIKNLQDFMRSQSYTEDDIEETFKHVDSYNDFLMKKYMIRMRIKQDPDRKNLPLLYNRWKEYTAIRKLIKYQFRNTYNQTSNTKADLWRAFKKWRNGPDQLARELWKLPIETIQDLALKTTNQVQECSDQIAENQSIQNHLLIQRDEFLGYYVKSQILAMALIKDRSVFAQMQSWSRWNRERRLQNKKDLEEAIRDATYIHANLTQREKEISENNTLMEGENKDLRNFDTDGAVVRDNMAKLQAERDNLAKQMADSEADLIELQQENEELKRQLEQTLALPKKDFTAKQSMKAGAPAQAKPELTPAQIKEQERFAKLAKLSQGAKLR